MGCTLHMLRYIPKIYIQEGRQLSVLQDSQFAQFCLIRNFEIKVFGRASACKEKWSARCTWWWWICEDNGGDEDVGAGHDVADGGGGDDDNKKETAGKQLLQTVENIGDELLGKYFY